MRSLMTLQKPKIAATQLHQASECLHGRRYELSLLRLLRLWLEDGHLHSILWTHARQQQRCNFDLVLAALADVKADNLEDTLTRLRYSHICPELLAGESGRVVAVEDRRLTCAAGDAGD